MAFRVEYFRCRPAIACHFFVGTDGNDFAIANRYCLCPRMLSIQGVNATV